MKLPFTFILIFFSCICHAGEVDCKNAMTTYAMNSCAAKEVDAASEQLEKYLAKAKEKYSDDNAV